MAPSKKNFSGGCHCGYIRYTADIDLTEPKASKCNCSICLKTNRLSLSVTPEQFKLVSPSSFEDLADYTFGSKSQHHYFCKACGIHCVGKGSYVWEGKEVHNMSINAVTLDEDQGIDLRAFKVTYWDGRENNWGAGAQNEPYPGGCY